MKNNLIHYPLINRMILGVAFLSIIIIHHLKAESNPIILLKGVESAREQIPPSRLLIRFYTQTKTVTNDYYFSVLFDKERRYFSRTNGLSLRSMYNGTEVIISQAGVDNKRYYVSIRNLDMETADVLFDPRILGIALSFSWKHTIQKCLVLDYASKIELIGKEQIDNKNALHIRTIRELDGVIKDFWIDDKNNFRVYKCVNYIGNDTNQINSIAKSYYENEEYPWLPSRVETETYNGIKHIVQILKVEANIKIPENQWTLAGIDIPKKTSVIDERTRKMGYWDGKQFIPWGEEPKDLPILSFGRPIILIILILLSVVPLTVVVVYHYRKRNINN